MAAVVVASVLALVVSGSARAVPPTDLPLGISWQDGRSTVVRVDPISLRPTVGPRLALASVSSWSFSPDRSRLALAPTKPDTGGCGVASLRFVDTKTLSTLVARDLRPGAILALAWLRRDRLLALYERCRSRSADTELLVVDTATARVVARTRIDGALVRAVITKDAIVGLVAPAEQIGPAKLVVLGATDGILSVSLAEISAGHAWTQAGVTRSVLPGLASAGRHAYVIPAGGPIAEVDLNSLQVSYHRNAWRHPAARAKASEGTSRHALQIGEHIAIFGRDGETFTDASGGLHERSRPAGLELIDTRNWSIRKIDDSATWVVHGGDRLLATRHTRDSSTPTISGMGVAGYDIDGRQHFHLFPGKPASVDLVYRGRAYVDLGFFDRRLVVEASSGRVLGWRKGPLPTMLLDQASGYWRNGI